MLALLGVRASGSAWGSEGEAAFGLQQGAVRTLEEYLYGGGAAAARPEDAEWQLPLDLAAFAKSLREKPVEASDLHDFESAKAEVVRLRTLLAAAAGGSTGGDEITVATCRRSAEVPDDFDKTVMPALAKLIAGDRPVRWLQNASQGWDPEPGKEMPDLLFCREAFANRDSTKLLLQAHAQLASQLSGLCFGALPVHAQAWDRDVFWSLQERPVWQHGTYPFVVSWNMEVGR
jgi:hypothetical protein